VRVDATIGPQPRAGSCKRGNARIAPERGERWRGERTGDQTVACPAVARPKSNFDASNLMLLPSFPLLAAE
jgi:hypothetical protein